MKIDIENITEDEACKVFTKLYDKFGWSGTVFTTWGIVFELENRGVEATDELVELVKQTTEWRKSLLHTTAEWGFECLTEAIEKVLGIADPDTLEDQ